MIDRTREMIKLKQDGMTYREIARGKFYERLKNIY